MELTELPSDFRLSSLHNADDFEFLVFDAVNVLGNLDGDSS